MKHRVENDLKRFNIYRNSNRGYFGEDDIVRLVTIMEEINKASFTYKKGYKL